MRAREQTQPAEQDIEEVRNPGWEGPCPTECSKRTASGHRRNSIQGSTIKRQLACGHFAKDTGREQRNAMTALGANLSIYRWQGWGLCINSHGGAETKELHPRAECNQAPKKRNSLS